MQDPLAAAWSLQQAHDLCGVQDVASRLRLQRSCSMPILGGQDTLGHGSDDAGEESLESLTNLVSVRSSCSTATSCSEPCGVPCHSHVSLAGEVLVQEEVRATSGIAAAVGDICKSSLALASAATKVPADPIQHSVNATECAPDSVAGAHPPADMIVTFAGVTRLDEFMGNWDNMEPLTGRTSVVEDVTRPNTALQDVTRPNTALQSNARCTSMPVTGILRPFPQGIAPWR